MRLRGGVGAAAAASVSLAARSAILRRGAPGVLRRGGLATVTGLAAMRSPDRTVLVRDHDTMTGAQLDAAVRATAAALAERWPEGGRIGVRGDGGIDFVVVLAAAGLAGLDAMAIGPRHGAADVVALAGGLDGVVDAWEVFVRGDAGGVVGGFETRRLRRRSSTRVVLLSTGTSGVPVATERGRLGVRGLLQLADADRRLRLPDGPMLVLAPPDHGHGLTMLLAGLMRGRTVVLASAMRPAEQAELAVRHRVATVTGVPAQLARLVETDPDVLAGVRLVVSGSSRLAPELRVRLEGGGARVLDCYGSTETGTVAIDGRPLAGVTIDVDAGGGILITSPLGGPSPRDPGDIGRIEGGRLIVEGRRGPLVDSGGELVSPERVASTLRALPGVTAARVWAEHDDLLGSVLCAEVRGDVDEATVRAALTRAEMPRRISITAG